MPGSLQNKLQQFEIAPPPFVWSKIAERLDQEFEPGDSVISTKLNEVSIDAPPGMWNKIEAGVYNLTPAKKEKSRIISIVYKVAVAASLIGLISLAAFYFFRTSEITKPEIVRSIPAVPQKSLPAEVKPLIIENQHIVATVPVKRKNSVRTEPSYAPLYELNTVTAIQTGSVSAPPLRDKSGNLILDLATISNSDNLYITVTGPNGKQTKISSKFLNCLGYINANLSLSEMDSKGIRCTLQFEEWRRKLLNEPEFIPTANNFFDIFEMKDMLQEM